MSIADTWRLAGTEAERLGLCRPGYHSILGLVLDERERRIARREAIVDAVDELWSYTGPDISGLIDQLSETRTGREADIVVNHHKAFGRITTKRWASRPQ